MQTAIQPEFQLGQCVSYAWESFKRHASVYVLATFILLVGMALVQAVLARASAPVGAAAGALVCGLFIGGLTNLARIGARGGSPTLNDAFVPFTQRQGDYLIIGLAAQSGMILCGIGVLITQFLFMFSPLLVTEGNDFKTALKQSYEFTSQRVSTLILLFLTLALLNFAGALLCGLGLFVSVPVSILATVRAYDQLAQARAVLPGTGGSPGQPGSAF